MILSYLKITLRNFAKYGSYSLVNILSMSVGIAVCALILIWARDELSFDKFHRNAENIYRIGTDINFGGSQKVSIASAPLAPAIIELMPEAIDACRMSYASGLPIKHQDKLFKEEAVRYADNHFLQMFNFPLIYGDPKTALEKPLNIVLTESTAKKYFGDENPLGKTLFLENLEDYTVTGVAADLPANTVFNFNILRSMETLCSGPAKEQMQMWNNIQYYNFVSLKEGTSPEAFNVKIDTLLGEKMGEMMKSAGGSITAFLEVVPSLHLKSTMASDMGAPGSISTVYVFLAIAGVILLIACANYINLSVARASARFKEIGIRKVLGANRNKLICQFLFESIIVSLCAGILAIILIEIASPLLFSLAAKKIQFSLLSFSPDTLIFFCFTLTLGIIAGMYPAFYLSAFRPVVFLKGTFSTNESKRTFQSVITSMQFIISIALIIGVFVIYYQLHYIRNKDLGLDPHQVMVVPMIFSGEKTFGSSLIEEFKNIDGVLSIGVSNLAPSKAMQLAVVSPEGFSQDQTVMMNVIDVDHNYIPTLKIQIVSGRNFYLENSTDLYNSILINETAVRQLGWDDPLGKTIACAVAVDTGFAFLERKVIGVVRDFHSTTLYRKIEPLLIGNVPDKGKFLVIRLSPEKISHSVAALEKQWEKVFPHLTFDYFFLDESYQLRYRPDYRLAGTVLFFSILAVFLSCFGLFSMSTYLAERRTKEIGIRKVHGASVNSVLTLLLKDFFLIIAISNFFAWPLAYYFTLKWLQNFAYRVDIHNLLWTFPAAGIIAVLIALLTISFQSYRAATINPVELLRYE